MQLRDPRSLTSEAYVAQRAWQDASLARCPRHLTGGCGFARHGTYPRTTPVGMRITRYYCPTAQETFSLLPDCLASRFPGDLEDLERVVAQVDAARSIEATADVLRPDIVLPSAVRWVRRRLTLVRVTLLATGVRQVRRCGDDCHAVQVNPVRGVAIRRSPCVSDGCPICVRIVRTVRRTSRRADRTKPRNDTDQDREAH